MKNHEKIDKILMSLGILYLVIPICIQLFFWYTRIISVPLIGLLLFATYKVIKELKPIDKKTFKSIFNKKKIIIFLLLIIVLNIMSGAGGLFYQNWDYNGRNAIFRDLINNSWPVRYDYSALEYESSIFGNGGILNYYFAFWLPGAIVGKLFGFKIASLFMLLWQTLGVSLFFYYVFRFLKTIKIRYFWIFITFGGLNVIGYIVLALINGTAMEPIGVTHIDTSMGVFCMSSFITQLFWVFNQSLPTWVVVLLFLQDKDYKKCGYYFALLVPFGPFPMLGFLYLIFTYIIFGKEYDKVIDLKRFKELFTIPNIFGCLSVLPVVFMYTLNESRKGIWFIEAYKNGTLGGTVLNYVLFVLLEFLVYAVVINKKNYKQILVCFMFFGIAPLFFIGGADLGNRSTIPLLLVMYLIVCEYLNNINKKNTKVFRMQIATIVILCIASITNFNEFYRGLDYTYLNYKNNNSNYADAYETFTTFEGKECAIFITNFVATDDPNNKVLQFMLRG